MFRKILLISVMFLSLAGCETIEETIELANFGEAEPPAITQWYRAYVLLDDDMDNPASPAFQNYAQQAKADPGFEGSIIIEFDSAVKAVISDPRAAPDRKRKNLNTLSRSVKLLAKHRLVSAQGISQMYGNFDRQTATAYRAGRIPIGLHDVPIPARELPAAMVKQPHAAFEITWRAAQDGDYEALRTLLEIGRKVAAGGNNQIERMTLANLRQAQLSFPAWRDHVMKYYPDLAKAKMRALETRLAARFEFQNRQLGQQTHQRLLALMPDIQFVAAPRDAEAVLVIREVTFQTEGLATRQEKRSVSRGSFDYYTKNEYPNITQAEWTETTTKIGGQWAIHLDLLKPDGTRISERTVRGEKTETVIQCSKPTYSGFGAEEPQGWPNGETTARCENPAQVVIQPDHIRDLAIDATMVSIQSLIGPLRKVQQPSTK